MKYPAPLLMASGLTHGFSGRVLFRQIGLRLDAGEITILRGDNGTGKTTLLRMLAGLMTPLAGQITIDGVGLRDDRVRAAGRMVFIGHRDGLAAELSAREAIGLWAQSRGLTPDETALKAAFESLGLAASMDQPVRVLSAGQRRRCGMVRLALIDALGANQAIPLWLLDEPTTAMDTTAVAAFAGLLRRHAERGGGILMTSHLELPLSEARQVILGDLEGTEVAA
ncbi:MAG: heme ABC exporter ATP-binding protein CcmA [Candidatus Puniceispirillales bacterium]